MSLFSPKKDATDFLKKLLILFCVSFYFAAMFLKLCAQKAASPWKIRNKEREFREKGHFSSQDSQEGFETHEFSSPLCHTLLLCSLTSHFRGIFKGTGVAMGSSLHQNSAEFGT